MKENQLVIIERSQLPHSGFFFFSHGHFGKDKLSQIHVILGLTGSLDVANPLIVRQSLGTPFHENTTQENEKKIRGSVGLTSQIHEVLVFNDASARSGLSLPVIHSYLPTYRKKMQGCLSSSEKTSLGCWSSHMQHFFDIIFSQLDRYIEELHGYSEHVKIFQMAKIYEFNLLLTTIDHSSLLTVSQMSQFIHLSKKHVLIR